MPHIPWFLFYMRTVSGGPPRKTCGGKDVMPDRKKICRQSAFSGF